MTKRFWCILCFGDMVCIIKVCWVRLWLDSSNDKVLLMTEWPTAEISYQTWFYHLSFLQLPQNELFGNGSQMYQRLPNFELSKYLHFIHYCVRSFTRALHVDNTWAVTMIQAYCHGPSLSWTNIEVIHSSTTHHAPPPPCPHLSVSVCLLVCLSVCLSIHPSIHPSFHPSYHILHL